MYKKIVLWATVAMLTTASMGAASASGWSGRQVLSQITHRNDRTVIVRGLEGDWNNPDVCDDASRAVLSPANATSPEAFAEQYAALLGAQLTGRDVNVFFSGCITLGGVTRPVITQIAIY